jgi:hypothetical protein
VTSPAQTRRSSTAPHFAPSSGIVRTEQARRDASIRGAPSCNGIERHHHDDAALAVE